MNRFNLIVLMVVVFIVGNKFDVIKDYLIKENDRIQKIEYCNDFYKGRSQLLNACLAGDLK